MLQIFQEKTCGGVSCCKKVAEACKFIKKTLKQVFFCVNIVDYSSRTPILKNICERLLLTIVNV